MNLCELKEFLMMKTSFLIKILTAGIFSIGLLNAAYAAGDSSPSKPAEPKPVQKKCPEDMYWSKAKKSCVCKEGKVWSKKAKICVAKSSEVLTDEDLYKEAVSSINAKDYNSALDLLWRIKDQNQPRVLNYLGYANRKLGKIDEGIKYYHKALKIDANFNQARQYLGEGYLQKGDLKNAQGQLEEIAKRCGTNCEYYKDLSKEIAVFKSKNTKAAG